MAQGRRVRRVIRKVDTWTVLRFSIPFYLSLLVVVLVASMLLWAAASAAGVLDSFESFIEDLVGFESFQFRAGVIFRSTVVIGLIMALLGTGLNVLVAVIYNLTSDIVGGIEVSVLEEEPVRRTTV